MGTRIRRLLGAAAVVFGFPTLAAAQTGPLHRGIVHDNAGNPLPGVVVTIQHPQQKTVRVALTDLWGEYTVGSLERGTRYIVEVSHPRFRTTRLQASAGDHINVRLKLRHSSRSAPAQATGDERP